MIRFEKYDGKFDKMELQVDLKRSSKGLFVLFLSTVSWFQSFKYRSFFLKCLYSLETVNSSSKVTHKAVFTNEFKLIHLDISKSFLMLNLNRFIFILHFF